MNTVNLFGLNLPKTQIRQRCHLPHFPSKVFISTMLIHHDDFWCDRRGKRPFIHSPQWSIMLPAAPTSTRFNRWINEVLDLKSYNMIFSALLSAWWLYSVLPISSITKKFMKIRYCLTGHFHNTQYTGNFCVWKFHKFVKSRGFHSSD